MRFSQYNFGAKGLTNLSHMETLDRYSCAPNEVGCEAACFTCMCGDEQIGSTESLHKRYGSCIYNLERMPNWYSPEWVNETSLARNMKLMSNVTAIPQS